MGSSMACTMRTLEKPSYDDQKIVVVAFFFFEGRDAETSYDKKPSPEEKQSKIPRIRAI